MRLLHDSRRRLLDILNTKRNRKSEVPGMHIMLCLGGVKICLDCEKEIQIEDVFLPFIIRERSGISGQDEKWKETDILAAVSFCGKAWRRSDPDLLSQGREKLLYCVGGRKGSNFLRGIRRYFFTCFVQDTGTAASGCTEKSW